MQSEPLDARVRALAEGLCEAGGRGLGAGDLVGPPLELVRNVRKLGFRRRTSRPLPLDVGERRAVCAEVK